ncbi:carbon starvation protein A [bacterium]|nr:carbon starvation protein A [bacterium]
MSASILIIAAILFFIAGYILYGKFLIRKFQIDPAAPTPAHTEQDGVDFVPARTPVLLGHHFASIAGAGPILGPVYAAVFGWVPVFLWIVIGSIFFGGVHDFASVIASVRHGGRSIGEVIEHYIGRSGKRLFLIFTWLMLILVIAVFAKAVASTFAREPAAASSSVMFIGLAVLFGLSVYRLHLPLWAVTAAGVLLLFTCVYLGILLPVSLGFSWWIYILFVYVCIASVTPVWILLQPRDFLNSFLLYFVLIAGVAGIVVSNPRIEFPAIAPFTADIGPMFPILFVTVACGAISGFHSLVASGTTSKQLDNEADVTPVAYGSMLIEGVLAVLALITAAVLLKGDYTQLLKAEGGGPITIFSNGVGGFIASLGIPRKAAAVFAALAISAFALTSLDTATRLGRFIFQEFTGGVPGRSVIANRYVATGVTAATAFVFTISGTGSSLWPLFGSANQLLAAIVLLAVTVWFAKLKRKNGFVKYPMFFMFAVTLTALGSLVLDNLAAGNYLLFGAGITLLAVALVLIVEAVRCLRATGEPGG